MYWLIGVVVISVGLVWYEWHAKTVLAQMLAAGPPMLPPAPPAASPPAPVSPATVPDAMDTPGDVAPVSVPAPVYSPSDPSTPSSPPITVPPSPPQAPQAPPKPPGGIPINVITHVNIQPPKPVTKSYKGIAITVAQASLGHWTASFTPPHSGGQTLAGATAMVAFTAATHVIDNALALGGNAKPGGI